MRAATFADGVVGVVGVGEVGVEVGVGEEVGLGSGVVVEPSAGWQNGSMPIVLSRPLTTCSLNSTSPGSGSSVHALTSWPSVVSQDRPPS
jgi:hypothetical protein